jgi:hypothetical protein
LLVRLVGAASVFEGRGGDNITSLQDTKYVICGRQAVIGIGECVSSPLVHRHGHLILIYDFRPDKESRHD